MQFLKPILLALSVLGCASAPEPQSPFPADTRSLFPGEHALELVSQCSRAEPSPIEGTWTPDEAVLDQFDAALPAIFDAQHQRDWQSLDLSIANYHRQYGGLVIGGRRIVYVNAFRSSLLNSSPMTPRDPTRTWRNYPMRLCDGGPSAFGAQYNPDTGQISNFQFDGSLIRPN